MGVRHRCRRASSRECSGSRSVACSAMSEVWLFTATADRPSAGSRRPRLLKESQLQARELKFYPRDAIWRQASAVDSSGLRGGGNRGAKTYLSPMCDLVLRATEIGLLVAGTFSRSLVSMWFALSASVERGSLLVAASDLSAPVDTVTRVLQSRIHRLSSTVLL